MSAVPDRATAKARNRAEFPGVAAIMDECRAAFGADVKMAYAREGGRELGKPVDDSGLVRCTALAPPSARATAFRAQAEKAFYQRFNRYPRASGDGEWAQFYSEYAGAWPPWQALMTKAFSLKFKRLPRERDDIQWAEFLAVVGETHWDAFKNEMT